MTLRLIEWKALGTHWGFNFNLIPLISFWISNSILGLRVKPLAKACPNPRHCAKTGQCYISANTQSRMATKAPRIIACIELSNGGLISVVVVSFFLTLEGKRHLANFPSNISHTSHTYFPNPTQHTPFLQRDQSQKHNRKKIS